MRKPGSKERIRQFLLAHIGEVITSIQIRDAAGEEVSEWARRVRELREDEHWPILTHNDSADLKPGQYLLKEAPPEKSVVTARGISAKLRAEVFDRNGFTCQWCGLTPGDIDPYTGRKVRLHLGHIKDKNLGGKDELSTFGRCAHPVIREPKTSQVKNQRPSGFCLKFGEPDRTSSVPCSSGSAGNSESDRQNFKGTAQRKYARRAKPWNRTGDDRAALAASAWLPIPPAP